MRRKHSTCGNKRRILGFGRRNLKERTSLEDPGIDGRIIFKRSLNEMESHGIESLGSG